MPFKNLSFEIGGEKKYIKADEDINKRLVYELPLDPWEEFLQENTGITWLSVRPDSVNGDFTVMRAGRICIYDRFNASQYGATKPSFWVYDKNGNTILIPSQVETAAVKYRGGTGTGTRAYFAYTVDVNVGDYIIISNKLKQGQTVSVSFANYNTKSWMRWADSDYGFQAIHYPGPQELWALGFGASGEKSWIDD